MKAANNISFLQEKIEGIGSALFYNLSSGVLKFPTSIVNILQVDELGNAWFFAKRPEQRLTEFDMEFPAYLQFYRKGKGYYLQITGRAYIVNDPEDLNGLIGLPEEVRTKAFTELVLIKVKISNASYYENPLNTVNKNSITRGINRLYGWLFNHQRPDHVLQPAPSLGF